MTFALLHCAAAPQLSSAGPRWSRVVSLFTQLLKSNVVLPGRHSKYAFTAYFYKRFNDLSSHLFVFIVQVFITAPHL